MNVQILKDVIMGDMIARYYVDEDTRNVELQLLPQGLTALPRDAKKQEIDSLIQLQIAGDVYTGNYAGGSTLRMGGTTRSLRLKEITEEDDARSIEVVTSMQDSHGGMAKHHLRYQKGEKTVRSFVEYTNEGEETVVLEMLSSFSLGGMTPFTEGDAHGTLKVHRVRSVWSMEGRLQTERIEDLQLEPSWAGHAVRCERFGQAGTLTVNHYFPWLMIEDEKNHVFWGMQVAHNASWQMEMYRRDDALSVSGGLADYEFGHWKKNIAPGETFVTPEAILTVCVNTNVDSASQRLTSGQIAAINAGPAIDQDLPVMYNEYCTTWGCPSEENIAGILEAVRGKGFRYFVIDCGWFKEDGVPWDISMGDYEVSKTLFPHGLEHTVKAIREAGMVPGIWFEIDNIGRAAKAYRNTEHLLKRDGVTLTTSARRFWNMTDPWVQDYLHEKVIDMLNHYGFGYIKMDFNDSLGLGCDGCESLGEGLRRNMEASFAFIERMKEEVPGLIVENCASGGHKLEPKMLGVSAMSSFSDAHECLEIPVIAANLHRVMQPRQSQIWAVIHTEDSLRRIAYLLTSAMLGRMCLSGDVTHLDETQWKCVEDGIAFYNAAAPVIRDGESAWFGEPSLSYRHLTGWQGIRRQGENGDMMCIYHRFEQTRETMDITLPDEGYGIVSVYKANGDVTLAGDTLSWNCAEDYSGCAVLLRKKA